MTEAEFRTELKSLHGGYLFYGEEDYLKYSYAKEVEKRVLSGSFDEFNHIVIYGDDFSPRALADAIATLPMMEDRLLVEVRGVSFNALKKDEVKELEGALASLSSCEQTILLIRADKNYLNIGSKKKPSEVFSVLCQYCTPVEFTFPAEQRLNAWILRHFTEGKIDFEPTMCSYLVQICGRDMWNLSLEIEKLCAYAIGSQTNKIEKKDIDAICPKTTDYSEYQFSNALLSHDKALTMETLYRQKVNHESPFSILSALIRINVDCYLIKKLSLFRFTQNQIADALKMNAYKVSIYQKSIERIDISVFEQSVFYCQEADIKSKSQGNLTGYTVVERLLMTLLDLWERSV